MAANPKEWKCRYCNQLFQDEPGQPNSSIQMNRHIDAVHHRVCEGCGCDDCSCNPPPTAEEIARWGPIVEETRKYTRYQNRMVVSKGMWK